jgi:hypothetical protein
LCSSSTGGAANYDVAITGVIANLIAIDAATCVDAD